MLDTYWDEHDINRHVPSSYKGSKLDRIAEFIAAHPAPEELLAELGQHTLREIARNRRLAEDLARESAPFIAREILRSFGFDIPTLPSFTLAEARDGLERSSARLVTAQDQDAAGIARDWSVNVERMIKFILSVWGRRAFGDAWSAEVRERCDVDLRPEARPSMGDWVQALAKLPARLQDDDAYFAHLRKAVRRSALIGGLEQATRFRNDVAHDRIDVAGIRAELPEIAAALESAFRELDSRRALPVVVVPLEEVRDRYGRLRLRAEDERHHPVEMFVLEPVDLRGPLVWMPGDMNPVDVAPSLIRYDDAISVF